MLVVTTKQKQKKKHYLAFRLRRMLPMKTYLDTNPENGGLLDLHDAPSSDAGNFGVADSDIEESYSNGKEESVVTGTGTGQSEDESSEKLALAKRETRAVLGLRILVFAVLLLAAVAVSVIVYITTKSSENEEFRSQYEGAANRISEAFMGIVETHLSAISSLGVASIAHGVDHDSQRWPYVTLSSFQQRAYTARKQSLALYIHVNPRVELDQREEWESYTGTHPDSVWM